MGQDSDELEEVEKELQEKEAKQSRHEAKRNNLLARVRSTPIGAVLAPNACNCCCSSRYCGGKCGMLVATIVACVFFRCTNSYCTAGCLSLGDSLAVDMY